jgi:hypothetical protein
MENSMKVKLSDVYVSVPVLTKVLDLELPVNISYKFMKLVNNLNQELKNIEEQRVKLVKKYSSNEEGTNVSDDKKSEFLNEFTGLLNEEIEINWEKMVLTNLGNDLTKFRMPITDIENASNVDFKLPPNHKELAPGTEWQVDFGALTRAKRTKCGAAVSE